MTAEAAANESCLPQTVYMNADTRLHELENARTEGLRRAAVTHGGSSDGRPD